jgi:hypothetical protein
MFQNIKLKSGIYKLHISDHKSRSSESRCALRLQYVDLVVSIAQDT